jgi:hypothetical protein
MTRIVPKGVRNLVFYAKSVPSHLVVTAEGIAQAEEVRVFIIDIS